MELMRVRILVYVCVLISCDVQTNTASMKDSEEQSALQEALLLVELLKSEYARLLRDKSPINEKEIEEKDLQTCATTTAATDAVRHKDGPIRYIEQSSTTKTLESYTAHGSRRSYPPNLNSETDFPRRRYNIYRDYYGSYGPAIPWRRMDYENVFGPQPGQTIPTSTASQSTTVSVTDSPTDQILSSVSNTLSTNVSETPTSSILLHTSSSSTTTPKSVLTSLTTLKPTEFSTHLSPILSSTIYGTLTSPINNKQPISISHLSNAVKTVTNKKKQTKKQTNSVSEKVKVKHKKLFLSMSKTTITSTFEPEQAQVAAEIENELEAAIGISTSLPSSSSHLRSLTWRPSTRLHLARSTPYILPLPENHAFCYTNPKSSLCRTFIK